MNFKIAFCFFLITGQLFSQDFVNGSFTDGITGWGCNPEILPETTYGGSDPNNIVAEIDQEVHLCQTLNGFKVGTVYSLSFLYSPRTTGLPPAIQEVEFSIDKGALPPTRLTRLRATGFNWVNIDFCFTAVSTTHTFSFKGLSPGTHGIIIDDIKISTLSIDLGKDFLLCKNNTKLLNATHTNATSYLWQDGSTKPTFTVTKPGVYWAKITNKCGDSVVDTINVIQKKIPIVNLGNDITFCENKIFTTNLNATTLEATSYLWQDNSSNPNLTINKKGFYWVEVSNNCGSSRDTINVITENCDTILFFIPNTFTPNGDPKNNLFKIKTKGILSFRAEIFDQGGALISTSTDMNNVWDGKNKERTDMPINTYGYKLVFVTKKTNEILTKLGFINLIR